jgi:hypothetical protein
MSWAFPYFQTPTGLPLLIPHTIFGTFFVLWPLFRRGMRRGWSLGARYRYLLFFGPLIGALLPPLFFLPQLMLMGAAIAFAETILWIALDWSVFGRHETTKGEVKARPT